MMMRIFTVKCMQQVPSYCNYFKNFAEQEFCLETVLFW